MSTGQDCCASALTAWTLFEPLSERGISPLVAIVLLTTRVASGEEHGATTIRAPDCDRSLHVCRERGRGQHLEEERGRSRGWRKTVQPARCGGTQ